MENVRAVIIGASGQMGTALTNILSKQGIYCTGIDCQLPNLEDRRLWNGGDFRRRFILSDATAPDNEVHRAVKSADVVIIALSIELFRNTLLAIRDYINPSSLLVETLSVKLPPGAYTKLLPDGAEFLGINPLFAPSLEWKDRPVLAVPHKDGPRSKEFLRSLAVSGAQFATIQAKDHDKLLARRQGATHAAALALGALLQNEQNLNMATNIPLAFGPPPYQLLLMVLARILNSDPHIYADIQTLNDNASTVREELRKALTKLDGSYEDVIDFIESMKSLKSPLLEVSNSSNALFRTPILSPSDLKT